MRSIFVLTSDGNSLLKQCEGGIEERSFAPRFRKGKIFDALNIHAENIWAFE